MKYKCQCGAIVNAGDDHYCRAYPDKLLARIAELETTLQEIHQHYDDVHAEEINALNARIAELEGNLIQCPRCGDPITNELGDNPICGACALGSELNVKTLQERVAELEKRVAEMDMALESSARKLKELGSEYENCPPQHNCPSDLGMDCSQCWLDWLMNNNQNKGDTNE